MEAVQLNNEAMLQMTAGDYSSALETLSSALIAMRTAIQRDEFPSQAPTNDDAKKPSIYFVSRDAAAPVSRRLTIDFECCDWFLYDEALEINYEAVISSAKSVEILSYAIIYNLGLCYHLQGLKELLYPATKPCSSNTAEAWLERAISMYTQAIKLLFSHELDNLEEVLHTMAITNNLGHAHHFLNDEASAKLCFERLLRAIMYISGNDEQGRSMVSNHELFFDGFLTNAMNLIGNASSAPAA